MIPSAKTSGAVRGARLGSLVRRARRSLPPGLEGVAARHLPLVAVMAVVAAFTARYALDVREWRVMTDELTYVKLALGISESLSPLPVVRGESIQVYNQLYPLLLAPIVGLFDMPTAFRVAHALNVLLMVSAAIPAYLMTRWLVGWRVAAFAVAAVTICVPWLAFSLSLMTESVAYPVFIWSVYAIARTVAAPSPGRDAAALAAVVCAYLARTQLVFLALLLPIAVILHEVGLRVVAGRPAPRRSAAVGAGLRASLQEHKVLAGALVAGAVLALVGSATGALGAYQTVIHEELLPAGTLASLADHVNEISVAIAVVPLALSAAWTAATLARPLARRDHAFAVVLLLVVPATALIATSFDLNFGGRSPQERYVFYVVPLLLCGAAACVLRPRPPLVAMAVASVASAVLVLQTSYVPGSFAAFASPSNFTYVALDFRAGQLGRVIGIDDLSAGAVIAVGTVVAMAALGALIRARRARLAFGLLGAVLLAWCSAETAYVLPKAKAEHEAFSVALGGYRSLSGRDWIDDAVPRGRSVALVPSPINDRGNSPGLEGVVEQAVWWEPEFWNKRVDRVYRLEGADTYTPLPQRELRIDRRSGALRSGAALSPYLVLADSDVRFAPVALGRPLAYRDLRLYRVRPPYRVAWTTSGIRDSGLLGTDREGGLTLYGDPVRPSLHRVTVLLSRARGGPRGYRIDGGGLELAGRLGRRRSVTFEACVPAGGRRVVRIRAPGRRQARVARISEERPGVACRPGRASALSSTER